MEALKRAIRDVPDFPKSGIIFKDITPLLQNGELLHLAIQALADRYRNRPIDRLVGIESRGFIFGAALAYALKKGFSLIRKKGKLPWDKVSWDYALEYGTDTVEMHSDAVQKGDRVLLVDDVLATGGTAAAACQLIEKMGGKIEEAVFIMELGFLKGREKLEKIAVPSFALIKY